MQIKEFKRILTTFADSPADIDLSKGKLILQYQDHIVEAELEVVDGSEIVVVENGAELSAREWIIKRLVRLPLLADRILSYVKAEEHFVVPKGRFLDQIENSPEEIDNDVQDALDTVREVLSKRIAGASSILYLTSDAGEGKTTLINQLAREQAVAYKSKTTDWLLLPVPLAGRTLLRFDDVVIATLVNQLRFQMLYFSSFIEIVRLGAIIPAFDGFEEMFVESSTGEAESALGNLVGTLKSSGNVLIAARKAYFEYKSLDVQARLFDSIDSEDVRFARLSLQRWDKNNFVQYCHKRNILHGEEIYESVVAVFGSEHPLLTRAVLVRRLLDVATEVGDREQLLQQLGNRPEEYFLPFIRTIIEREVKDKWIDRSGDAAEPLLTVEQHQELLSLIAQEMWINGVDSLREDLLELVAELYCENISDSITMRRQVKDRIKHHALIVPSETSQRAYKFDHDDFRHFFMGEGVGRLILSRSESELRTILQIGPLSFDTLDGAISRYHSVDTDIEKDLQFLLDLCVTEGPASFVRENVGGLIIRLLNGLDPQERTAVYKMSFPGDSLTACKLCNIDFHDCHFQPTSTQAARIKSCVFRNCMFERIEISEDFEPEDIRLIDCNVISIVPHGSETTVFAPESTEMYLRKAGFALSDSDKVNVAKSPEPESDLDLALAERAFKRFLRSTNVSIDVFKVKMGINARRFVRDVLPRLRSVGIVEEIPRGKGGKVHYKLKVPMQRVHSALAKCDGSFSKFISLIAGA